jgi:dUTPase
LAYPKAERSVVLKVDKRVAQMAEQKVASKETHLVEQLGYRMVG